jgi:hypothetical protein
MRYNDKPLYEQNKTIPEKTTERFYKARTHDSALSPSPLYVWWQHQANLRSNGYLNEIDVAEIIAASRGTINQWSKLVKDNLEFFTNFIGYVQARSLQNDQLVNDFWKVIVEYKKSYGINAQPIKHNVNKFMSKFNNASQQSTELSTVSVDK